MQFKTIELMMNNQIEHHEVFLGEEDSYNWIDSPFEYGEYNGHIVECIKDYYEENEPFVIVCNNKLKFIEPLKNNSDDKNYKPIKLKDFDFKFSFDYKTIAKAYDNNDQEILEIEFKRIKKELEKLIKNPFYLYKENQKGIIAAIMFYFSESISLYYNVYDNEKVEELEDLIKKLYKIYEL